MAPMVLAAPATRPEVMLRLSAKMQGDGYRTRGRM